MAMLSQSCLSNRYAANPRYTWFTTIVPYALFGKVHTLKFVYVLDNDLARRCMLVCSTSAIMQVRRFQHTFSVVDLSRKLPPSVPVSLSIERQTSTHLDPVHRLPCSERKATRFSNAEDLQQHRQAKGQ